MFRHRGRARTLKHNLRIASLLSFVAGMVNVAGFVSVQRLTTNVTGHFAFFVDEVFKLHPWDGVIYFLYIFFFFAGSFVSSFLMEALSAKKGNTSYAAPVVIESLILCIVSVFGQSLVSTSADVLAFLLLFAMGLQNSLVTTISNATVRTTHLTGLFTDLGIELSQLFFYRQQEQKDKLYSSIKLRMTIISFFFLGGLASGILYATMNLFVLAIAAAILLSALVYDTLKLKMIRRNRRRTMKMRGT